MRSAVLVSILSILFFVAPAKAEYRVFKLQFENSKTHLTRQILATLDPVQYQTIFPLTADETVTYVQTWRCKGRTDQLKAYCQSPELKP